MNNTLLNPKLLAKQLNSNSISRYHHVYNNLCGKNKEATIKTFHEFFILQRYLINVEEDYKETVSIIFVEFIEKHDKNSNGCDMEAVLYQVAKNIAIIPDEDYVEYIYENYYKPILDHNKAQEILEQEQLLAKKQALEIKEQLIEQKTQEVCNLICKRFSAIYTNELWNLVSTWKYGNILILDDESLAPKDIANLIVSGYEKAPTVQTPTLDIIFTSKYKAPKEKREANPTGDTKKRESIKRSIPEIKAPEILPQTDEEVEQAIVDFLRMNKWRNHTYMQILDKVAPHYKNKKTTRKKDGRVLSLFNILLNNQVEEKTIIKTEKEVDGKKYTHYKYCPEKQHLHRYKKDNEIYNKNWLPAMCKIIDSALNEFTRPLTQIDIIELVGIYCEGCRKENIIDALRYMVAVGYLKTTTGACNRCYYSIDTERNLEEVKNLKKSLLDQYL